MQLLPWLEGRAIADELAKIDGGPLWGDWSASAFEGPGLTPAPPASYCPADGEARGPFLSYHPNTGVGRDWLNRPDGPFQVPPAGKALRIGDVRDGSGTTAGFAEALVFGPEPLRTVREARHPFALSELGTKYLIEDCRALPTDPDGGNPGLLVRGMEWPMAVRGNCGYGHAAPPNTPACVVGGHLQTGLWPADSGHRGTVNVALLDGAVRGVADAVDPAVWRALGTHAGGEVVPDSF